MNVLRKLPIGLVVVGLLGCSSKPQSTKPTVGSSNPEPAVQRGELRRELESSVLEILGQLTLGNIETYADSLRRDKPVTLIGARDGDTFVGDGREAVGLERWPLLASQPEFVSKNLDIHVSEQGEVGWSYDEVSVRIFVDGRVASLPLRLSLVFTRDIDRWVVALDHWSFPLSVGDIGRAMRDESAIAPAKLDPLRDSPYADTLVNLVGRLVNGDPRARSSQISSEEHSLAVLPGIDGEFRGQGIQTSPTLLELFEGARTVGLRDYRIESSASGEVAWMAANLVVRGSGSDPLEIKLRATYVFEHGGSGWKVVHSHLSVPVPSNFFAELVGD